VPRDVASWTLNRNFRNSVDSQIDDKSLHRLSRQSGGVGKMRYDLIASDDEYQLVYIGILWKIHM